MIDRLEFALFSILGFAVRLLPLRAAQSFGKFLGSLFYWLFAERRAIAILNLRHAFPEKSDGEIKSIARGAFQNFGISVAEFVWFPRMTPRRLRKIVRLSNIDLIEALLRRGKGLILMSGHFGNWELLGLSTAHFSGHPITIIVHNQRNQLVHKVLNQYRCRWGNSSVPRELSVRESLRRLTDGKVVAMAADQSASRDGLFVRFFGRPAATHRGPAIFSLRTGAPIVMGFLIRNTRGKHEGIFEEVKTDDLRGYSEEHVAELTRRHVAVLERYVRQYPDHWLWMHRRWKHTDPKASYECSHASQYPRVSRGETSESSGFQTVEASERR